LKNCPPLSSYYLETENMQKIWDEYKKDKLFLYL